MKNIGTPVLVNDLIDVFEASEGSINMYYGKIGNGKTYAATADILDLLKQGKVVYCNWRVIVEDFDDRWNFWMVLRNTLFFRKRFYRIPCAKNLHYFDPEQFAGTGELVEWLSGLNDCHIFFDEGQDMFDSYEGTKFSKAKRRLILHTRHYHRTLNIISQRPTAIQVSARGNVNRFYKCVKLVSWPWVRFARYEFQDMVGETVDENAEPVSRKTYWGSSRVFRAYNTDYLSEGIPKSQSVFFEAYDLSFRDKMRIFAEFFREIYSEFFHKRKQHFEPARSIRSINAPVRERKLAVERTSTENHFEPVTILTSEDS